MTQLSKEQLFKEKLKRIYDCTGTKTQKELAKALGVQQSTISSLQKKQSIPNSWLVALVKKYSVNIDWIENAVEPKYNSNIVFNNEALNPLLEDNNSIEKNSILSLNEQNRHQNIANSGAKRVAIYSPLYNGEVDSTNNRVFEIESYMTLPDQYVQNCPLIFRYINKNMEPIILKNALIGIDTSINDIVYGEIMAFCLPQQGISLYKVYNSNTHTQEENFMLDLKPVNPDFPTLTKSFEIIKSYFLGKVIWTLNVF